MSDSLPIAAIQMVSGATVEPNLETAQRLVAEAVAGGARLVVLPEFFPLLGRKDTDKVDAREPAGDGPIQHFLAKVPTNCDRLLPSRTKPSLIVAGISAASRFNRSN